MNIVNPKEAGTHISVGSAQDLRTRGRWSDPRLGQYSFRGLMIVIATRFIPLSPLSIVSTMVMWENSRWLVACKEYFAEYWLKEHSETWPVAKCFNPSQLWQNAQANPSPYSTTILEDNRKLGYI